MLRRRRRSKLDPIESIGKEKKESRDEMRRVISEHVRIDILYTLWAGVITYTTGCFIVSLYIMII